MTSEKKRTLSWQSPRILKYLGGILAQNRVILCSTDTVLGLLAPCTQQGYEHLDAIKQRTQKPYLVLLGSPDQLPEFIDQPLDIHIEKLVSTCWPGPLTFVFKARADIPSCMKSVDGTIAVRVPDHAGLRHLATQFHGLFSTSANIAQRPVPISIDEVDPQIRAAVDACIIDAGKATNLASTILDCSTGVIRVVRVGLYPIELLQKKAGVKFS